MSNTNKLYAQVRRSEVGRREIGANGARELIKENNSKNYNLIKNKYF